MMVCPCDARSVHIKAVGPFHRHPWQHCRSPRLVRSTPSDRRGWELQTTETHFRLHRWQHCNSPHLAQGSSPGASMDVLKQIAHGIWLGNNMEKLYFSCGHRWNPGHKHFITFHYHNYLQESWRPSWYHFWGTLLTVHMPSFLSQSFMFRSKAKAICQCPPRLQRPMASFTATASMLDRAATTCCSEDTSWRTLCQASYLSMSIWFTWIASDQKRSYYEHMPNSSNFLYIPSHPCPNNQKFDTFRSFWFGIKWLPSVHLTPPEEGRRLLRQPARRLQPPLSATPSITSGSRNLKYPPIKIHRHAPSMSVLDPQLYTDDINVHVLPHCARVRSCNHMCLQHRPGHICQTEGLASCKAPAVQTHGSWLWSLGRDVQMLSIDNQKWNWQTNVSAQEEWSWCFFSYCIKDLALWSKQPHMEPLPNMCSESWHFLCAASLPPMWGLRFMRIPHATSANSCGRT